MLKVIKEFPDYSVNEYGEVYSRKSNKWLSRRSYDNGYWVVSLRDDAGKNIFRSCHTLAAKAFLEETFEEGLVVNHKDLDKTNCHISNLEWVTVKRNAEHYVENMPEHASSHRRDISVETLREVGSLLEAGLSTKAINEKTGVSKNKISKMRTGALYSWLSKDFDIKPEPITGITDEVALEICNYFEKGKGCKFICDQYPHYSFITKATVNNIKYRLTFEHISKNFTWWKGKYLSKSERRAGKTLND